LVGWLVGFLSASDVEVVGGGVSVSSRSAFYRAVSTDSTYNKLQWQTPRTICLSQAAALRLPLMYMHARPRAAKNELPTAQGRNWAIEHDEITIDINLLVFCIYS
jgi:hypothetical protein